MRNNRFKLANHTLLPWRSLSLGLLLATLLTPSWRAWADWAAMNLHAPATGTATNVTMWNIFGAAPGNGGPLKDIATGLPLGAQVSIASTIPAANVSQAVNPAPGTPASNTFQGLLQFNATGGNPQMIAANGQDITYTFTNLNPAKLYSFKGTGVRGEPNYANTNRWGLFEIVGATSFISAHTKNCLTNGTPGVTLTGSQVAINTAYNSSPTNGDIADWEKIVPNAGGGFSVTCVQYTGPLPNGTVASAAPHAYGITAFRLQEEPPSGSLAIGQQPGNTNVTLGGNAYLNVLLSTGNYPQYQWFKVGPGAIAGATFPSLAISNVTLSSTGRFYVVITNLAGERLTSSTASVGVVIFPLVITNQPDSQTYVLGTGPLVLDVGVSGTLPWYQWYSNSVKIASATNSSYSFTPAITGSNNYLVVVTNYLGSVTSTVAKVVVVGDNSPIQMVVAGAHPPFNAASNVVLVTFNKPLLRSSTTNLANYHLCVFGTPTCFAITNLAAAGSTIALVANANLADDTNYTLCVFNVSGTNGLPIQKNCIGITMAVSNTPPAFTNLFPWLVSWTYLETDATTPLNGTAWQKTNYTGDVDFACPDGCWGNGQAVFYKEIGTHVACSNASFNENVSSGYITYYFRTRFVAPSNLPPSGTYRLQLYNDDGIVVYLNGTAIYTNGMPAGTPTSGTFGSSGAATCRTLTLNSLGSLLMRPPATNVITAELHESGSATDFEIFFGAALDFQPSYLAYVTNTSPIAPSLILTNKVLSWTNAGGLTWSLQSTTNLLKTNTTVWTALPNTSPYTVPTTGPRKMFRLHTP